MEKVEGGSRNRLELQQTPKRPVEVEGLHGEEGGKYF